MYVCTFFSCLSRGLSELGRVLSGTVGVGSVSRRGERVFLWEQLLKLGSVVGSCIYLRYLSIGACKPSFSCS
jgi:hypothetical protein